jgi:hypothetical protein
MPCTASAPAGTVETRGKVGHRREGIDLSAALASPRARGVEKLLGAVEAA